MIVTEFIILLEGVTLLTPNARHRMMWAGKNGKFVIGGITKAQRRLGNAAVRAGKGPWLPSAEAHRDIFFTLVRGKRQHILDADAIPSAVKPFLDGIVDSGVLRDDSPKWCSPHYLPQQRAETAELRVRIEE